MSRLQRRRQDEGDTAAQRATRRAARIAGAVSGTRVLVAAGLTAGLVATALALPDWSLELERTTSAGVRAGTSLPARTVLVCPGQSVLGVEGAAMAAAAVAPVGVDAVVPGRAVTDALAGGERSADDPGLTLTSLPSADASPYNGATRDQVTAASAGLAQRGAGSAEVVVGQSGAGVVAAQLAVTRAGDLRGAAGAACTPPTEQTWLVGGGGEEGRRGRLVLTNPGANPVTADVTVHSADGVVDAPAGRGVVVPARGRTVLLLDALAPGVKAPAVHVAARGGELAASLHDSLLTGTTPRGTDDVGPAAAPARRVVVPGVALDGDGALRVVAPGTEGAVVRVRVLGPSGPVEGAVPEVVRVRPGGTTDVPLDLPDGVYTVELESDVPVTAGAWVRRAKTTAGPADLAWTAATAPVRRLTGLPVVRSGNGWRTALLLGAVRGFAVVEVVRPGPDGGPPQVRTVRVAEGTTSRVDLDGAGPAWLRVVEGSGEVSVARLASYEVADGELLTVTPMADPVLESRLPAVRPAG